jgi:sugar/nucleoside kinase (ribokinase family)
LNSDDPRSALDQRPSGRPVVLVAGSATRDLTGDDPRGWRIGGAVTYGSLALARLGLDVRAFVGADAEASVAAELELLRDAGVDVEVMPLASGPVFENIERPGGRRQRCIAVSGKIPVGGVPARWPGHLDALLLAPVAGELDDDWASFATRHTAREGRRGEVGLGWQGLLRDLRAGADVRRRAPEPSPLLRAATIVGASRNDFGPGTEAASLVSLLAPGATLVLTEGAAGGVVMERKPNGRGIVERAYLANPSSNTVDPTGAGDVFLAAMLACRLDPSLAADPDAVGRFAAATAALTIEAPGLLGIPGLDAVRRRMTRAPSRASRRPSATSRRGSGRPSQA